MRTVAVYNMKGGVGKTTTAVNLSYLAAASGLRTLVWDLDPQAAASFMFRVRPGVSGFGRHSLEDASWVDSAIKETDHAGLYLLPADFAYRKLDRFLGSLGHPERLIGALLAALDRDFDLVLLDCPAGFSLLTEAIVARSDVLLVPTIPSALSLRLVARLARWADRAGADVTLAPFFSMIDRRKALHRWAAEWAIDHPGVFLRAQVPYASVVEQMGVRRSPLALFAPREPAAVAFNGIWAELQSQSLEAAAKPASREARSRIGEAIDALLRHLEPPDRIVSSPLATAAGPAHSTARHAATTDLSVVHRFDTDRRDLERGGRRIELLERGGAFYVVASASADGRWTHDAARVQIQIDSSWAVQILSGEMSPLVALERRLGRPGPQVLHDLQRLVSGKGLRRQGTLAEGLESGRAGTAAIAAAS